MNDSVSNSELAYRRELDIEGPLTLSEMLKLLSVLDNPPQARQIRQALRFYAVPDGHRFEWFPDGQFYCMLLHYALPQEDWELKKLMKLVAGKTRLLEIGSSFGGTLRAMASVMPKCSQIVAVDLDCDDTPKYLNPLASLKQVCQEIAWLGGNVQLMIGDSHDTETVERVSRFAPFDFAFIDGDHSYDGAKKDWENYGPMASVVGFHDIAGGLGCSDLWQEIKASGKYRTEEFIADPSEVLGKRSIWGIGVVYREHAH